MIWSSLSICILPCNNYGYSKKQWVDKTMKAMGKEKMMKVKMSAERFSRFCLYCLFLSRLFFTVCLCLGSFVSVSTLSRLSRLLNLFCLETIQIVSRQLLINRDKKLSRDKMYLTIETLAEIITITVWYCKIILNTLRLWCKSGISRQRQFSRVSLDGVFLHDQ